MQYHILWCLYFFSFSYPHLLHKNRQANKQNQNLKTNKTLVEEGIIPDGGIRMTLFSATWSISYLRDSTPGFPLYPSVLELYILNHLILPSIPAGSFPMNRNRKSQTGPVQIVYRESKVKKLY